MMSTRQKRTYVSAIRQDAALETRRRILGSAKALFGRKGIDQVTIDQIAQRARVSASAVYAIYKSKDGILRALVKASLFGPSFQAAQTLLQGVTDPVELIASTPRVARAIYESERSDLGLLRHASGFSPALRRIEEEFEQLRYDMQENRVRQLFEAGKARRGLSRDDARRVLWMMTSRDVHRMLVDEGGWTPQHYEAWLGQTLLDALVDSSAHPTARTERLRRPRTVIVVPTTEGVPD